MSFFSALVVGSLCRSGWSLWCSKIHTIIYSIQNAKSNVKTKANIMVKGREDVHICRILMDGIVWWLGLVVFSGIYIDDHCFCLNHSIDAVIFNKIVVSSIFEHDDLMQFYPRRVIVFFGFDSRIEFLIHPYSPMFAYHDRGSLN